MALEVLFLRVLKGLKFFKHASMFLYSKAHICKVADQGKEEAKRIQKRWF